MRNIKSMPAIFLSSAHEWHIAIKQRIQLINDILPENTKDVASWVCKNQHFSFLINTLKKTKNNNNKKSRRVDDTCMRRCEEPHAKIQNSQTILDIPGGVWTLKRLIIKPGSSETKDLHAEWLVKFSIISFRLL